MITTLSEQNDKPFLYNFFENSFAFTSKEKIVAIAVGSFMINELKNETLSYLIKERPKGQLYARV